MFFQSIIENGLLISVYYSFFISKLGFSDVLLDY